VDKPDNLIPLIDADILRYEIGFAAETGWRAIAEEKGWDNVIPPFHYVEKLLLGRLEYIQQMVGTEAPYVLYLTEGHTFRYDIAKTKPYKGTRKENKPWHYNNLSIYIKDVLGAKVVTGIEADDAISIKHISSKDKTIICSRDKDLRQLPGWFYSWELGRQPSFGPTYITNPGTLELSDDRQKLHATGLAAFYGQVLTGDRVDNIPGLDKCGPVAASHILDTDDMLGSVIIEYADTYGTASEKMLLEQGRLCWMTRRLHEDGTPVLWEIGMES
tara:strand:- start:213 stop:1031 length:819 start_codon:yes stop_codon:yes gene_type:complete